MALHQGGVTWFVEKRILDRLPEQGAEVGIHVGDHGKWTLRIEPAGDPLRAEPEVRWFPPADPYIAAYRKDEEAQDEDDRVDSDPSRQEDRA